ncbi:sensor histidine kinase [Nocardioides okcheonensis]|uniref:sensor histidine kinase n=1 Tax=Nocardioides okcheonensis TaxID=2894081 RepID=UPI001E3BD762|nr:ATP-binding protein [Nocardioides okcheonensis]UFN43211.1 histidine kinase [Nocardioides okcheonensis]
MVFSGAPEMRRSDLLSVVSVLDVDEVLERAATIGAERTGAGAVVLALVDERPVAPGGDDVLDEPRVTARGTDLPRALALRDRLGDAGLEGAPGERPEHEVVRLRDAAGDEVLRVPVVVSGRLFADLLLLDPPADGFADDDVESISVLGKVTGVAVRNALSYHLNEKRREAAELAAAVDQSMRPPFLLAEPTSRIADGALRISGARAAAVVAASSDGMDVLATAGDVDADLPHLLDEVADRVRAAEADGRGFVVRAGGRPVWGLPLSPAHAPAGVVVLVLDPARSHPSAEDRALLSSFVRHGSLVLDHGVLQQERQHAVLAADRDRIARDLHDVVIQRLYATALRLRTGAREGRGDDEHVSEAIREIGDSIREIRGTIFELERGRSASLRSDVLGLAREYGPALGFVPVVRTWGPVDSLVGEDLAGQATVVLRELLSNCVRHAGAGRCEVDLAVESGWFSLQVCDDGRGMPDGDVATSGLRNLRSRATDLGGELFVEPAEPRGTRVRWRVPLDPQAGSVASPAASVASSSAEPAAGEA